MDVDYRPEFQDFRREVFGVNTRVPTVFLSAIRKMSEGADIIFGMIVDSQMHAYWLRGRLLGQLMCVGGEWEKRLDYWPHSSADRASGNEGGC